MTISEMQDAITCCGWQWIEHVFSPMDPRPDCSLELSKSVSPHCFTRGSLDFENDKSRVGWGRFDRQFCWEEAYKYIVTEKH